MHKSFSRSVPGSPGAVLFIHGILGTPNHFAPFLDLVPGDMSLYGVLLEGHGGSVRDFSAASMPKWEAQIRTLVQALAARHERLYIAAHSMGCLLALEQAIQEEKIAGLFLLAPALTPRPTVKMVSNCLKLYFDRIDPHDLSALATRRACSIKLSKNILLYAGWIPRYVELFRKARAIRNQLGLVKTPCRVYLSRRDEMVSMASEGYLRPNPAFAIRVLEGSGHHCYSDNDLQLLREEFRAFLPPPLY